MEFAMRKLRSWGFKVGCTDAAKKCNGPFYAIVDIGERYPLGVFWTEFDGEVFARVDKTNGTHKEYAAKTEGQMLAIIFQCMHGKNPVEWQSV